MKIRTCSFRSLRILGARDYYYQMEILRTEHVLLIYMRSQDSNQEEPMLLLTV
jgi:hypothetical protein